MDNIPTFPQPSTAPMLKLLAPLLGTVAVIAGVASLIVIGSGSLDPRQRAATSTGSVVVSLKPGSTYLTPFSSQTIELQTNTGAANVTGYELFIDFSGTVPADLTYTPTDPTNLTTATSFFENTNSGKRLTIGLLAPIANPPKSFTTSNATVTLGTITFTSPASGSMTVAFNNQLSRSLLFSSDPTATETDVLKTPVGATYTFGQPATATPAPTTAPTLLPTPTPTPGSGGVNTSPTPTPRPSVTPTPTPLRVCYNMVITYGSSLAWPNGCRGIYQSGVACTQVVTPLTTAEIAGYNAWVQAGRPILPGCPQPTPTPTVRPTPTATVRPTPTVAPTPRPTPTPFPITPMPTVFPTPTPVGTPIGARCDLNGLTVTPAAGANWNNAGSFLVTNTSGVTLTFNWTLDAWSDDSLDVAGTTAEFGPGKVTQFGLGRICSKWSLNLSCPGTNQSRGIVTEAEPTACGVIASATPTIAPQTPVPTFVPRPTRPWNRLPAWLRQLLSQWGR